MEPLQVAVRPDLLANRVVLLAGPATQLSEAYGATVERWEDPASWDDTRAEAEATGIATRHGRLDAGVVDLGSVFGRGADEGMASALDTGWRVARAAATSAMIGNGGGTIVLLAPPADLGAGARAAANGLANMAKSLGTEWARFDIRVVAICPKDSVAPGLGDLTAWLCSGSGTYATGCCFEPGAIA
ncbi:MAG: hypothetical protein F2799_05165 [Actinobacteria bacterium]|uniref:Unannotated protein n=1 Tax=freshwater metagenome TaxID=449393 RepID=A0A6J7DZK8_9ZZZZ|nr:hypothetical protein [Actinomycetota bacterium]